MEHFGQGTSVEEAVWETFKWENNSKMERTMLWRCELDGTDSE
jgi:hypothetical protein